MTKPYQPKTGQPCGCRRGIQRDNCAACEGTGWRIDFAAIRARENQREERKAKRDERIRAQVQRAFT